MRTEQELKENKARYWRQMNAAFGLPAGTHPDDPNPPGSEEPEGDWEAYDQPQAQAVVFPHYDEVHGALLNDPQAMELFHDHWNDTFKPHDFGPMPGDPFGQLRWYILRDLNEYHHKRHKLDFEDAKKHRVRNRVAQLLSRLAHHDPLFRGTMDLMNHQLEHLPASLRKAVEEAFTRCPSEVLDFYREMRAAAGHVAGMYHARRSAQRGNRSVR